MKSTLLLIFISCVAAEILVSTPKEINPLVLLPDKIPTLPNPYSGTKYADHIVYYSQRDARWANMCYNNRCQKNMYQSGCAPTSLAMVVSTLLGKRTNPTKMASFALNANLVPDGTDSSYFCNIIRRYYDDELTCGQYWNVNALFNKMARPSENPDALYILHIKTDNPNGHYLVSYGAGIDYVYTVDPYYMDRKKLARSQINHGFIISRKQNTPSKQQDLARSYVNAMLNLKKDKK